MMNSLYVKANASNQQSYELFESPTPGFVVKFDCQAVGTAFQSTSNFSCWFYTSDNNLYLLHAKAGFPNNQISMSEKRLNTYKVGKNQYITGCSVNKEFFICTSDNLNSEVFTEKTGMLIFRVYPEESGQTFYSFAQLKGSELEGVIPRLSTLRYGADKSRRRVMRRVLESELEADAEVIRVLADANKPATPTGNGAGSTAATNAATKGTGNSATKTTPKPSSTSQSKAASPGSSTTPKPASQSDTITPVANYEAQPVALFGSNKQITEKFSYRVNPTTLITSEPGLWSNPDFKNIQIKVHGPASGSFAAFKLGDMKFVPLPSSANSNKGGKKTSGQPTPSFSTGGGGVTGYTITAWIVICILIALIIFMIWCVIRREKLKEQVRLEMELSVDNEMERYD